MAMTTIHGVALCYDDLGQGPPILFQHGYTSSRDTWREVIARLSDRYRCVALDARGAGDSGRPEDGYTIEQMAADVVALADALDIDRFTFVGHSMGGVIGMELGLTHADRLDKLVLVAPGSSEGSKVPPQFRARAERQWRERDRESMIRDRILLAAREHAVAGIPAAVDRLLSVSPGHYEGCFAALRGFRKSERLAEITTPTLVVAGAADSLLAANLADFARLPDATLHVFSRVSHAIQREVPDRFTEVLADFLEHGVVTAATLQARLAEAGD